MELKVFRYGFNKAYEMFKYLFIKIKEVINIREKLCKLYKEVNGNVNRLYFCWFNV